MGYEITITDPGGALDATFVPELGMVARSLRHRGEELFHQGEGLDAYAARGATFALPLLYPFANRLSAWSFELDGRRIALDADTGVAHRDAATGTAIHGLLAASPQWMLADADRNTVSAELDFGSVQDYLREFPFPHRIRFTATMSDSALRLTLAVIADRGVAVPVSFGFHPYLTLPGSDRRDWRLELPVARQTVLDARMLPTGETREIAPGELDGPFGERTFDTNFDRLRDPLEHAFTVSDDRRRIAVSFDSGYPVAQVYSPANADFICYEPMTAPIDALISGDGLRWVSPGERFEATFSIAVQSI